MRRNFIISMVGSAALHVGLIWGGELFHTVEAAVKKEEEAPTMEVMAMPPQEEEQPEQKPEAAAETDISDLAPPSQMDTPSASVDAAFSQQIQPPPPPKFAKGNVINIPTVADRNNVGKGVSNVFDIQNLDQKPEVRFQQKAKYPTALKRAGITGSATIQFIVDQNGDVRDVVAVKSTHREFENPAAEAVSKWKFRPGKKGNAAVSTRMEVEYAFTLAAES